MVNLRLKGKISATTLIAFLGFLYIYLGEEIYSLIVLAIILPLFIIRILGWSLIEIWTDIFERRSTFIFALISSWCFGSLLILLNGNLLLFYQLSFSLLKMPGLILLFIGFVLWIYPPFLLGFDTLVVLPDKLAEEGKKNLIREWPYSSVRHPIYLGEILLFLGSFLLTGRLIFIIIVGAWAIPLFFILKKEEAELKRRFGDEYKDYSEETGAFIPKLLKK